MEEPKDKKEQCIICEEKGPLRAQNDFSVQAFLVYVPETKKILTSIFFAKLVSPTICLYSLQI